MAGRVQHRPLGSAGGEDVTVGYIGGSDVVLEYLEALHPLEDGGAIGQDSLIGRMHIHRNGVNLEQFLYSPHVVKMAVRKENGVGREAFLLKKIREFLDAVVRRHAGIYHGAGLLALLPMDRTVGAQGVESKYAGMKHRLCLIIANLLTFCQLCRIQSCI